MVRYEIDRRAFGVAFRENAAFKDTCGGEQGIVVLDACQLVPRERASDTVLMFMHPVGGRAYLPMVTALAMAGHHVIYANSRYRSNDSALIMAKLALDLAIAMEASTTRMPTGSALRPTAVPRTVAFRSGSMSGRLGPRQVTVKLIWARVPS
jgi:hypothetical protein